MLSLLIYSHLDYGYDLFVTDSSLCAYPLTLMADQALVLDDAMFLFLHDCPRRTDPLAPSTVGAKIRIDHHAFFCCPARERKDGSIGTKPMMPEFFFKEEREEYSDGNECWEHR